MTITSTLLLQWIYSYLWPFCRVGAMLVVMPIFGSQLLPLRIRLMFALLLTFMLVPLIPPLPSVELFSLKTLVIMMQQVLIGIAAGLVFQLVFQVFIFAGQIIAMQSGLGFASMVDPASHVTVPLVSQFYLLLITLIFLSMNGHIVLIQVLLKSFHLLPISENSFSVAQIKNLLAFGSYVFSGAVLIALPAIIILLLINLILAVVTRAAPQFNIFTVGFAITLIASLIVVYLTINAVSPQLEFFSEKGFALLDELLRRAT